MRHKKCSICYQIQKQNKNNVDINIIPTVSKTNDIIQSTLLFRRSVMLSGYYKLLYVSSLTVFLQSTEDVISLSPFIFMALRHVIIVTIILTLKSKYPQRPRVNKKKLNIFKV